MSFPCVLNDWEPCVVIDHAHWRAPFPSALQITQNACGFGGLPGISFEDQLEPWRCGLGQASGTAQSRQHLPRGVCGRMPRSRGASRQGLGVGASPGGLGDPGGPAGPAEGRNAGCTALDSLRCVWESLASPSTRNFMDFALGWHFSVFHGPARIVAAPPGLWQPDGDGRVENQA